MSEGRLIPMSFFESVEDARLSLNERSLIALEKQLDLMSWLKTGTALTSYAQFMHSYGYKKIGSLEEKYVLGDWLRTRIRDDVLPTAQTYYVSTDMVQMVTMAAEEMPTAGLLPTDVPAETGFVYFANSVVLEGPSGPLDESDERVVDFGNRDIPVTEDANRQRLRGGDFIGIKAIAWQKGEVRVSKMEAPGMPERYEMEPGISYFLFLDKDEFADYMEQSESGRDITHTRLAEGQTNSDMRDSETLAAIDDVWAHDESIVALRMEAVADLRAGEAGPMPIFDFSGWAFGHDWQVIPYEEEPGFGKTHPIVDQARRLLLATWKMLDQKITTVVPAHQPRGLRRRAARIIPNPGDILLVRLRREYQQELDEQRAAADPDSLLGGEDDGKVWWTHRWLVRGHWRKQPCGPQKSETKMIWIAPYIKGPEDQPLVVKDKVFSLER